MSFSDLLGFQKIPQKLCILYKKTAHNLSIGCPNQKGFRHNPSVICQQHWLTALRGQPFIIWGWAWSELKKKIVPSISEKKYK